VISSWLIAIRGRLVRTCFPCLLKWNLIVPSVQGALLGFVMKLAFGATLAD